MDRKEIGNGISRILLCPEDAPLAAPVVFSDSRSAFLSLTAFESEPRPACRLRKEDAASEVRQTANGEVVSFSEGEKDFLYTSRRVRLSFSCPDGQVLTGLGQHEDGLFNYAGQREFLYQHNMKISIPFRCRRRGQKTRLQ